MSDFPFTIKYTSYPLSYECKTFCKLYIPGPILSSGKQQCYERVIDKENIHLFALWCHDNKEPNLFKAKVGLDLDTVYNYIYPSFEDSEITTFEILPECIPRASIERVIRELLQDYKIEKEAINALHQVAEEYLIDFFKNADACSKNAGRKTINVEDFKLISSIQK